MSSLLSEITALGEKFGYEGTELANFVKEQMNVERDERAAARDALQKEKEKAQIEKEKIEAEIRLRSLNNNNSNGAVQNESHHFGNWESKLIPKFSESEVGKFFVAFERVAEQLSWAEECWPIICQSAFIGKAQIAYAALSDEDSKDYSKVKAAILRAYELVPEAYRQKFRSWQKRASQTFVEYAKQKEVRFDEWLKSQEINDFSSLRELMLLEDFKNNLPLEIRTHIEEFDIPTLEEASKAADKYVLAHKGNFGKKGYKTGFVGKEESQKGSSSLSPKKGNKGSQGIVCYGCGVAGHVKRKCSELAKETKPMMLVSSGEVPPAVNSDERESNVKTYLKAHFGHHVSTGLVGRDSDLTDGREVTVLRDNGAIQSCILESSLPDKFVLEGNESVLLGGFPNTVSVWPLQSMYVECQCFSGWCKLAVVESLPVNGVDVVIGNDLGLEREGTAQVQGLAGGVDGRLEVCSKPLLSLTRSQARRGINDPLDIPISFPTVIRGRSKSFTNCKDDKEESLGCMLKKCDKQTLVKEQIADSEVSSFYREAEKDGELHDLCREVYMIRDDILYRVSRLRNADVDSSWGIRKQIVIPKKFRTMILKEAHENLCGGHLGIQKTTEKISKNFYWPTVKKDVRKFCKSCHDCQVMGKPNQKIPKAPLYPIPIVSEPFNQVVIDIVGPLPKTRSGFQYLLTIMDRTTRFPEVVPIRSIKSPIIIKHLIDFFARYGFPRELQSDRGTNFTSKLFKEKMEELGIKHILSTPYHPESQGILERFHGTLKSALGKYAHTHPDRWDEDIPFVLFALRSAQSESLGFSPYELVYGHNVRGPLDVLKDHWENESTRVNLLEHVLNFKERLQTILTWAQNNLGYAQLDMKERFDRRSKRRDFNFGRLCFSFVTNPR